MNPRTAVLPARALARSQPYWFWTGPDKSTAFPADDIKRMALTCAYRLRQAGFGKNKLLALPMEASAPLVAVVLGTWLAGGHFVLLPARETSPHEPTKPPIDPAVVSLLKPWGMVYDDSQSDLPANVHAVRSLGLRSLLQNETPALFTENFAFTLPDASELALLQMTSGSTGTPKAIPITHAMLEANCAGIVCRCAMNEDDHIVSWLPMNHDMGLSALTVALFAEARLTLIPVSEFSRNPLVWIDAISKQKGTVSPAPTFAYGLIPRLKRRMERMSLDLRSWRYAWVGAEPVFMNVLASFEASMQAFGLKPHVLKPSYGMAEAVVAVSCSDPGEPFRKLTLCRTSLFEQQCAVPIDAESSNGITLVSNGKPLDNANVLVVNEKGQTVPDGYVGEICISGPFVASRYLNDVDQEKFSPQGFLTGDLGFVLENHLYITGRKKDLIVRGGVNVAAHSVEKATESVLGLRGGTCIAFSDIDFESSHERIVVLVGSVPKADETEAVRSQVIKSILSETGLQVDTIVFTLASSLPRTTSGKVQRAAARIMWKAGKFSVLSTQEGEN